MWVKWLYNDSLYHPYLVLFLAAFCGGALGTERQSNGHTEAGRRTLAMVSLGACLFTILPMLQNGLSDPWRMAGQVITGIGFIGAGVLIRDNFNVKGLTTASTIWVAAAVGVCFGANRPDIAFFVTIFSIFILLTNKFGNIFRKKKLDDDEVEIKTKTNI